MGNCVSVSVPVVTDVRNSVVEQVTYKAKLKDDLHRLKTETEKLLERKKDVEREVAVAEKQPFMKRHHTVEGWLKMVEAAETEVEQLKTSGAQQVANLCLGGLCSKNLFKSSCRVGEKVTKMLERVAALKEEGDQFGSVAAETIQDDLVCERPCETAKTGSESTFEQVWKFVEEEQVRVFGLYGMAGVGKTTLLKKINNMLGKAHGDFVVIWISVDGRLELVEIQEQIAKRINLFNESWMSKSFEEKVTCIHKVLSRRKFVLLLDDIWERVDLIKAGIPHRNPANKSKVVFTTRLVEVCGYMEADEQFKVECLTEEEAWELFKSIVGDGTLDSHHEIPGLAKTVAKKCGGLLLALVTIARGMARKRTPHEWEHAIGVLRRSAYEFSGMEEKVFSVLKLSYDHLSSHTIRSCFEYCSLFPEGYRFSRRELIDYWIGEGLLDDKIGSQVDGYQKIGVLVNACLLEEVENDCVKMHNVIRDMALWITTKPKKTEEETGNFYVQAGNGLTEMPDIGEWQKVKKMSVMDNQIENVVEIPTCPDLRTLFLNGNRLKEIGGGFFRAIPNLQVLNLSNNPYLIELPSEIDCLVLLQHLDVSKTSIKELPMQLKSLLQMKCLNLEHTTQLQTIPQQFISGFPNLLVLRMLDCGSLSMQAVEDNVPYREIAEGFIEELPSLKCLTMLTITLKSFHAFKLLFSSKKLLSCTQSLKLQFLHHQKYLKARSADFKDLDTLHILDCRYLEDFKIDCSSEILSIRETCGFQSLRTVIISSCFKLRDLTWLILAPELKILEVSSCLNMRKIIDVDKLCDIPVRMRSTIPFSKLESLELQRLENLNSIHTTKLPFRYLKKIKVFGCSELKTLPLDSNSAQGGRIIIEGEQQWWGRLVWEDEATQNAFSPCFINS